jgi:MOSC domain-containing protein YiiM
MQVLSVNIGKPEAVDIGGKAVTTGIHKRPIGGAVAMSASGLEGDGIGDRKHHGGPDQAVYAYAAEHYGAWARELGRDDLTYGMMGENLTVRGWVEDGVCIGDTFRVGPAVVRVTGPRNPCYKLDWLVGDKSFSKNFADTRRFGLYLRVIEPGKVRAGDAVTLIEKSPAGLGVIELAELFLFRPKDVEGMRRALDVDGLAARIRAKFEERIAATT